MNEEYFKKVIDYVLNHEKELKEIIFDTLPRETFGANGFKQFEPSDFYEVRFKFKKE